MAQASPKLINNGIPILLAMLNVFYNCKLYSQTTFDKENTFSGSNFMALWKTTSRQRASDERAEPKAESKAEAVVTKRA